MRHFLNRDFDLFAQTRDLRLSAIRHHFSLCVTAGVFSRTTDRDQVCQQLLSVADKSFHTEGVFVLCVCMCRSISLSILLSSEIC